MPVQHVTNVGNKGTSYANECNEEYQTGATTMLMTSMEDGEFDAKKHFQFLQDDNGISMKQDLSRWACS